MNADKLPQLSLSEARKMALDILHVAEDRRRQTAEAEAARGIDLREAHQTNTRRKAMTLDEHVAKIPHRSIY